MHFLSALIEEMETSNHTKAKTTPLISTVVSIFFFALAVAHTIPEFVALTFFPNRISDKKAEDKGRK